MTAYADGVAYLLRSSDGVWVTLSSDDLYRAMRDADYHQEDIGDPLYVIPVATGIPQLADMHRTATPDHDGDIWHEVTITSAEDPGTVYDRIEWSAYPIDTDAGQDGAA